MSESETTAWAGTETNLGGLDADEPLTIPVATPKAAAKVKNALRGTAAAPAAAPVEAVERRTPIMLEDNEQIGPNGQFFGAQGKGYLLRPGEVAEVPDSILNILDTAVTSVAVVDSSQTIIGYRDRLRFPYRVITSRRA